MRLFGALDYMKPEKIRLLSLTLWNLKYKRAVN
jgi:hypothetical protein